MAVEGLVFSQALAPAARSLGLGRTETDKVLDVALDCGFGDVSNFNRAFRSEFWHESARLPAIELNTSDSGLDAMIRPRNAQPPGRTAELQTKTKSALAHIAPRQIYLSVSSPGVGRRLTPRRTCTTRTTRVSSSTVKKTRYP